MVRLITTDCFHYTCHTQNDIQNSVKIFSYFNFDVYSTYISLDELKDSLYSLNLLSEQYLEDEKFLIYINDNEYVISFDHKTIYSLKIDSEFKINDIIKSILITKNLIMLLSAGEIDKVYYIIDSKYNELYENILRENLKNEKGDYIVEKLGDVTTLVKKLPELETKKRIVFKYFTLTILFLLGAYLTLGFANFTNNFNCKCADENKQLKEKIETATLQLRANEEKLTILNLQYDELSKCIQKDEK